MPRNPTNDLNDDQLTQRIKELEKTIREMRTNQNKNMIVPRVSSDPTTLINGQMWYRTDTNQWKIYQNGTTRVI